MLGLKLNHVSKRGHSLLIEEWDHHILTTLSPINAGAGVVMDCESRPDLSSEDDLSHILSTHYSCFGVVFNENTTAILYDFST